jgi:hypothetical protein
MMRVRATGLGAVVGVAACFVFAPMASADNGPEIIMNPLPDTCFNLVNTPGVEGNIYLLRVGPPPGPPEIIYVCGPSLN